jgi:hypothetical protein
MYKQLTDVYALNHEALVGYRVQVRDSVNKIRITLLAYLGIFDSGSDIVSADYAGGAGLFAALAALEHGDALKFELVVSLGGEQGLPKTDFRVHAEIKKVDGQLSVSIPRFGISESVESDDNYHKVAELVFGGMIGALKDF